LTDANVLLGRLGTKLPLGGEIALRPDAAEAAVANLASKLGLTPIAMAEGILRLAAVSLAGAIKEVSVMRGIDPRDFALFPFGGAGPLHAAEVAAELGMQTVVVPPLPGNFSALGLLIADVRRDFVRTRVSQTASTDITHVRAALQELLHEGEAELAGAGFSPEERRFSASLDMRYLGQSFELSVPVALDAASITEIERAFGEVYAARYGETNNAVIEIVSYRLAAWGLSEKPTLPTIDRGGRSASAAKTGTRDTVFDGKALLTPIFDRDKLPPGYSVQGPALVEETGSTTVIPPGWSVALDDIGCLVFKRS
jgi:N-methylhydantoinase A